MNYYTVNEEELCDIVSAARIHSDDIFNEFKALFEKAEAACRARVVLKMYGPFIATEGSLWEEIT